MLTIAQIDRSVSTGTLTAMNEDQLNEAGNVVLFARDPAWLGEEPHLRCEVDACGLDDDRLCDIEQAIWTEKNRRQEMAPAAPIFDLRLAA